MAFGNTPKDVTLIPLGSVAVPNHTSGDLTALEGGPASTDSNGNETAPASMYVKDGGNVAQGSLADAAWSGSGSGSAISILKKIVAGQSGNATVIQSTGASIGTSWRIQGDYTEVAGAGTGVVNAINTDLIPTTDISAYKSLSLQLTGTWTATLTIQVSNDATNWQSLVVQKSDLTTANFSSLVANGIYDGPTLRWRYLRVRATAFTSNASLVGTLELYTEPSSPTVINAVQSGTWTTGTTTSGGATPFRLVSAASTNASVVKASAGQVYGYEILNTTAAAKFVKLYNKATTPAPATDNALLIRTIGVPANGVASAQCSVGLGGFSSGIGLATTGASPDTDITAVAVGDLIINVDFK